MSPWEHFGPVVVAFNGLMHHFIIMVHSMASGTAFFKTLRWQKVFIFLIYNRFFCFYFLVWLLIEKKYQFSIFIILFVTLLFKYF